MQNIQLSDILTDLLPAISDELEKVADVAAVSQLRSVIIPLQRIGGCPEDFSIMAFPYPRPTTDALKKAPLVEEVSYTVSVDGVEIKLDMDQFGQINWLSIKGAPNIFENLTNVLSQASENGNAKPFWEY